MTVPATPQETTFKRLLRGQLRNIGGFAISIACIAFMFWKIDFHQVGTAIANFKWSYLLAGLCALAVGYAMRILRWSVMLRAAGASVSFANCAAPFLGSIALNNVLPARLGDVVRALVFPAALGITKTASTGSLVLERLIDLATILGFLAAALVLYPAVKVPETIKVSMSILVVLTIVGLITVLILRGSLSRLFLHISERNFGKHTALVKRGLLALVQLLASFTAMSRVSILGIVAVLSILAWIGEAGLYWALLAGFGITAGLTSAVLVMTITTLATLVPSSPGYIGPFHLAAFAAVSLLGSAPDAAASFAVLAHAGIWLPTTLAGAIAILLKPGLFGGMRQLRARPDDNVPQD
jgi:uncharacterized protein (TIRG00374 family)